MIVLMALMVANIQNMGHYVAECKIVSYIGMDE